MDVDSKSQKRCHDEANAEASNSEGENRLILTLYNEQAPLNKFSEFGRQLPAEIQSLIGPKLGDSWEVNHIVNAYLNTLFQTLPVLQQTAVMNQPTDEGKFYKLQEILERKNGKGNAFLYASTWDYGI
jgi:hypothetical protein